MKNEKQAVQTDSAPKAIGPYSQAIIAGGMVYCSGQIPLDPSTGTLVTGDIATQTDRVLKNLQAVLKAAQCEMGHVVKTTIFLKDLNDFQTVNKVYGEYFHPPFPARSTIQVARLPMDAAVEIEAIAKAPL